MKSSSCVLLAIFFGSTAMSGQPSEVSVRPVINSFLGSNASAHQGRNSISGNIFGDSRRPLADVHVELLDDVYSTIGRTKTNGAGFYTFRGLSQGTFRVRVMPYGTDYAEQTQEVTIQNISIIPGGGVDNAQQDFYLKLKPNANAGPLAAPAGVVFVQAVPDEAKKLYEQGVSNLREKDEKAGFENLKRSLELFPNYYSALDRLGTEYVVRGYYEAGYVLLTKAVEVNPRSFSSTFGLGIALYNLKQTDRAVESLRRANTLHGKSGSAQMWLGIALGKSGKLDQAEAAFKRANELSKGKEPQVHWQMARLYSEQKRYKEAADELELFLKHQSDARDVEKIKRTIQQLRAKASGG